VVSPNENFQHAINEFGFVDPQKIAGRTIANLIDGTPRICLISAPPWYGKTFIFESIKEKYGFAENSSPYGGAIFTSFETSPSDYFRQSISEKIIKSNKRLLWVIDGFDEGEDQYYESVRNIPASLEELDSKELDKLTLIIFRRETDSKTKIIDKIRGIYEKVYQVSPFQEFQLTSLDSLNAAILFGDNYVSALNAIKVRDLETISGIPAIAVYVNDNVDDLPESRSEIWQKVLQNLLIEKDDDKCLDMKARWDVAKRLAALLTFSENDGVSVHSNDSHRDILALSTEHFSDPSHLRAANFVLNRTPMFKNDGRFHYFIHKNVREKLTAFALVGRRSSHISPMVLNENGMIHPNHHVTMQFLAEISKDTEINCWITNHIDISELHPQAVKTQPDALAFLDRFEKLSDRSSYGLSHFEPNRFHFLRGLGLETDLMNRITDPSKKEIVRMDLMKVAQDLGESVSVDKFVEILKNESDPDRIRVFAAYHVDEFGRADCLAKLRPFIDEFRPSSRKQREVVSILIAALLKRKLVTVSDVYAVVPFCIDDDVIDSTHMLQGVLAKYMVEQDAINFIQLDKELMACYLDQGSSFRSGSVVEKAAKLLAQKSTLESKLLKPLLDFVLALSDDYDLRRTMTHQCQEIFSKSVEFRREMFLQTNVNEKSQWYVGFWVLTFEDVDWLISQTSIDPDNRSSYVDKLISMSGEKNRDESERVAIVERIKVELPDDFIEMEEKREQQQKWEQEYEKERRDNEIVTVSLVDYVNEKLQDKSIVSKDKLYLLSRACFSENHTPADISGTFEELPLDLQEKVWDVCVAVLEEVEPIEVPPGDRLPSEILYIGNCFVYGVSNDEIDLSGELIRKWLPYSFVYYSDNGKEVIARCFEANRSVTSELILNEFRRRLSVSDFYLLDVPPDCWTLDLVAGLLQLFDNPDFQEASRGTLIEKLTRNAKKDSWSAIRTAIQHIAPNFDSALNAAVLNCLLVMEPDSVINFVLEESEKHGKTVLFQSRVLAADSFSLHVDYSLWSFENIGKLFNRVNALFPEDHEKDFKGGLVDDEHRFRRLRYTLKNILLENDGNGSEDVLDLLVVGDESMAKARNYQSSQSEFAKIFSEKQFFTVNVGVLVKVLNDGDTQLIRSNEDLINLLTHELDLIRRDIREDFDIFFYMPKEKKVIKKTRRDEGILQAYVKRRLKDRCPQFLLDREIEINSERKTDITVTANTSKDKPARVIIELKWSDNGDLQELVPVQLAKHYLIENGETHGIALVAWRNSRKNIGGKRANTPDECEELLSKQVDAVSKEHERLSINAVVFDMRRNKD